MSNTPSDKSLRLIERVRAEAEKWSGTACRTEEQFDLKELLNEAATALERHTLAAIERECSTAEPSVGTPNAYVEHYEAYEALRKLPWYKDGRNNEEREAIEDRLDKAFLEAVEALRIAPPSHVEAQEASSADIPAAIASGALSSTDTFEDGFAAGLEAAAKEVEGHWNVTGLRVDQKEQAERSASVIRRLPTARSATLTTEVKE